MARPHLWRRLVRATPAVRFCGYLDDHGLTAKRAGIADLCKALADHKLRWKEGSTYVIASEVARKRDVWIPSVWGEQEWRWGVERWAPPELCGGLRGRSAADIHAFLDASLQEADFMHAMRMSVQVLPLILRWILVRLWNRHNACQ